jgi:hypothetical protein
MQFLLDLLLYPLVLLSFLFLIFTHISFCIFDLMHLKIAHFSGSSLDAIVLIIGNTDFMNWLKAKIETLRAKLNTNQTESKIDSNSCKFTKWVTGLVTKQFQTAQLPFSPSTSAQDLISIEEARNSTNISMEDSLSPSSSEHQKHHSPIEVVEIEENSNK